MEKIHQLFFVDNITNRKKQDVSTDVNTLARYIGILIWKSPAIFSCLVLACFLIGFISFLVTQCCFSKRQSLIRQIKFLLIFCTITQKHEHLCFGILGDFTTNQEKNLLSMCNTFCWILKYLNDDRVHFSSKTLKGILGINKCLSFQLSVTYWIFSIKRKANSLNYFNFDFLCLCLCRWLLQQANHYDMYCLAISLYA